MRRGEKVLIDFLETTRLETAALKYTKFKFTKEELVELYYNNTAFRSKVLFTKDAEKKKNLQALLDLPYGLKENDVFLASGYLKERLLKKSNKSQFAIARYFIMAYYYGYTNKRLSEVAGMFNKDHATLIYGIKQVENFLSQKYDNDYKKFLVQFKLNISVN